MTHIVIFLAFALILFGFAMLAKRMERKRTEALRQAGLLIGFRMQEDGGLLSGNSFNLFQLGKHKALRNLLVGKIDGHDVKVFDYEYVTGSGKSRKTHKQTVLLLSHDRLKLPQFTLRSEGLFDKIANLIGFKDINLDHSPDFSKKYRLSGSDENSIRRVFSQRVAQAIEQHKKISLEGQESSILIYEPRVRIKPEQLGEFVRAKASVGRSFVQ